MKKIIYRSAILGAGMFEVALGVAEMFIWFDEVSWGSTFTILFNFILGAFLIIYAYEVYE